MSGDIHPLPQYAFIAWCLIKAQGQLYLYLYLYITQSQKRRCSPMTIWQSQGTAIWRSSRSYPSTAVQTLQTIHILSVRGAKTRTKAFQVTIRTCQTPATSLGGSLQFTPSELPLKGKLTTPWKSTEEYRQSFTCGLLQVPAALLQRKSPQ
jgi:hypothetical protein